MFKNLQAYKTITDPTRVACVDVFRGLAIVPVVLYHFGALPLGYIGVDLFFVISGLLVGGLLMKRFNQGKPVKFFRFILSRGFKIWPSYYFFLLVGGILAYFFYRNLAPQLVLPAWDMPRYALFYQNFTGAPFHWCFDHVWSLCVEEHFYILLPLLFIFAARFFPAPVQLRNLVLLTIIASVGMKVLSVLYTNSQDTYSATPFRIDALAWGVLLNFAITKITSSRPLITLAGFALLSVLVVVKLTVVNLWFDKVVFHTLLPFAFYLMILGVYRYPFKKLLAVRFVAYYSYNWYLWHPLFVYITYYLCGNGFGGLVFYLAITFVCAMACTVFIEEPALKLRERLLKSKTVPATAV